MSDSSTSPLWAEALRIIKPTVTQATFNAWLKNTTATQRNGHLVVVTPSPFALELLEKRLYTTIQRAVNQVSGQELEIKFEVVGSELEPEQPELFFTGSYRDAYNQIVKPDELLCTTRYYHDIWRPILGNDLWLLVWEMRRRCFWKKDNPGKSRDTIEITFDELAAAVCVSVPTIRRLLFPKNPEDQAILARFVTRVGIKRVYSNKIGRTVNEKTTWKIRLDDPLTPEDEIRLANMTSSTYQNDM